ncbi:hypothetical protein MN608_00986 [Microdochium nivale]|nr:hypothetical protein MN608_00986 [Microdochium nivale]
MADKRSYQKWTDETHSDILIALSDNINLTNEQWAAVMETLKQKGHTFTESALKHSPVFQGYQKFNMPKWDDPDVASSMLGAILLMVNFTGDDYQSIADKMTAQGHETGKDALRYANLS